MQTLWVIRPIGHTAHHVSTETNGEKEEKKAMARRKLTLEEQLRGVRAALKSRRTPPQLKAGLQRRKEALESALGRFPAGKRKKENRSFLDNLPGN
jgi:hypothetical protein